MLTIKFDLPQSESVEVIPISDVHIGNPLCDEQAFKNTIDYILQEPDDPNCARVCLLNGDLTESVTRSSKGNLFEMTLTPSVQVAMMVKYLLPLTETSEKYPMGKIISYCGGNHDEMRYKDTGISSAESIAVGLHLEDRYSPDGCYTFISMRRLQTNKGGKIVASVYNTHMTGGSNTVGGKANRVARISNGVIADIICGAHVHLPMTFKEDIIIPNKHKQMIDQKTITYVISNSFLRYGDYALRASYKPGTISVPRINIRQKRECNSHNDARYLFTEVSL